MIIPPRDTRAYKDSFGVPEAPEKTKLEPNIRAKHKKVRKAFKHARRDKG